MCKKRGLPGQKRGIPQNKYQVRKIVLTKGDIYLFTNFHMYFSAFFSNTFWGLPPLKLMLSLVGYKKNY